MRIGFKINDATKKNLDLSNPIKGNPGIGGSEFAISMLSFMYAEYYPQNTVYILHNEKSNIYSDQTHPIFVENDEFLDKILVENNIDILVMVNAIYDNDWYKRIKSANVKIVYIMANFMQLHHLKQYRNNEVVARIVFVGKEQYSWCIDDELINKSCIIGNIISNQHDVVRCIDTKVPIVTYMGALVPQKGFHVLAKQWKRIVKKVPNAQLYVIGSGTLYSDVAILGKYGVASEEYENSFMPYLLDGSGEIIPSVHFMGNMGQEKEEILLKTWVGVPNPTAETETFCNCAVEMEGYGIPIVTKAKNSFFDVTKKNYSSLLFYTQYGFYRKIIKLLKNAELNKKMGSNAQKISGQFTPENLIPKWKRVFDEVMEDKNPAYCGNHRHLFYNLKILRIINRFLRIKLKMSFLPTALEGYRSGIKKRGQKEVFYE